MTIPERIKAIEDECSGVWAQSGVTGWERARLEEWRNKATLSEKQMEVLEAIEARLAATDTAGRLDDDEDRHLEH